VDFQHLKEQLELDYKFLKQLEDRLRFEDDSKRQEKFKLDIEDLRNKIFKRQIELQKITENQNFESQSSINDQDFSSGASHVEQSSADTLYPGGSKRELLSLADLASFCSYGFPLLRWMYEPVPAKYVGWYFRKVQEFFMFEGEHIPQKRRFLHHATECFFRCAYALPSEDIQNSLEEASGYVQEKLWVSCRDFLDIFRDFGYKPSSCLEPKDAFFSKLSLETILFELKKGLFYTLNNICSDDTKSLTLAEKDVLTFMIYVIDFLFKEHSARKAGKHLDLPEGVVLKLHDILNHAFQNRLGVKLPRREDTDMLADSSSFICQLMWCWKDQKGEDIDDS
jgi:hypothetical protein